jgi:hypothetical protein
MTLVQRIILSVGFVGILILCLAPPYQWERTSYLVYGAEVRKVETEIDNADHYLIWDPPQGWTGEAPPKRVVNNIRLDLQRLGIYVSLAAATTLFAAFVVFRKRK